MKRPFNFGAGPAQLPEQVLRRLSEEAINWKGSGMAVAELPHRGKLFSRNNRGDETIDIIFAWLAR